MEKVNTVAQLSSNILSDDKASLYILTKIFIDEVC